MKFSEISYRRADLPQWKAARENLTAQFLAAGTFGEADSCYRQADAIDAGYRTMVTLARIRRDINTLDPFYEGECAYYDREMPKMQPVFQAWTKATLDSPFRRELEAKYGDLPFVNGELALKSFHPDMIQDLQQENALVTRYTKLLASAQIPFRGGVYTLSQLSPWKLDPDDEIRKAAWVAEGDWYNAHGQELDEIYDSLVKLRDGMGKKLGYDGYTPLGYCRMRRNCYDLADVEKFRLAVQEHLVPLAKKLYQSQAGRQGRGFPLSFADKDLTFLSGNPRPVGTPEEILNTTSRFYQALSPESDAFWRFMREHEMMDVESRKGKAGGGYCTRLDDFHSPFIFANFNGTAHDVKVVTHEAGHAFAGFRNRDRIPATLIMPSLEACEVHSMSMEFFAWPWAEEFFGEDAQKFRYHHLLEALTFIPYGTMVDHFQHVIYEYPDFSPEERHQVWRELLGIYMPWVKPGEIPFYGEGKGWQRQSHIYSRPFYYIDYCLARTVALEFWVKIQHDPKDAFQTYLKYTDLGGTLRFTDLLSAAGLDSPFQEATLERVCREASAYLENFDMTGIE